MANQTDGDRNVENKTSPNATLPVIRRFVAAGEDGKTRLLKRHAPAWVVSGLFHVVLITAGILINEYFKKQEQKEDKTLKAASTITKLDEPPQSEDNLTLPDPSPLPDLPDELDPINEPIFEPAAPGSNPNELPLPNPEFFPSNPAIPGALTEGPALPGTTRGPNVGIVAPGSGVGNGFSMPGFEGRGKDKGKLVEREGGTRGTEEAVARGLVWLAKQQNSAGYWEFDGNARGDRIAATGMCLLPFLAAGETHVTGKTYKDKVARGLTWLKSQLKANGQFGASGMYSQAIATIALCEAAGMTQDKAMQNAAKAAVQFIITSQGGNGSWGYTAGTDGDTSIVGWNIQALKSARLAGIAVPDKVFKQAEAFLTSVSSDSGASYGYRGAGATHTLSAVGLLCRYYLGWGPRNGSFARGVNNLASKYPPLKSSFDMYYYYYATQVMHFFGGEDWTKWNLVMRQMLVDLQITEKTPAAKAADIGSWPKDQHFIGSECGKVGSTALCILTLEVYYRHLPLYKRDGGGLKELEKGN